LTSASAKPAKPISADQQPSAIGATSHRSAVASAQQSPTQASNQQPAIANIAPTRPTASSDQSGASAVNGPNLRQAIGLVSDVGTVAASAVYTVANTFAAVFGPHSFLGVPYALATAVANTAAATGRTLIGAPLGSAGTGPFPVNYGIIDGLTFLNPQQPPPGANDPSITVTAEHPLPIILLNGTIATQGENWGVGAPVLANAGYKVYTFNYGNITQDPNYPIQATDDIRQSGLQLAAEVDKVLAETGAPKVILIGHSQGGGILPVYYINDLGGADKVSQLIGIAPSNHGTDVAGLIGLQNLPILGPLLTAIANSVGQALEQQALGSTFQQEVYGDGDTRPGVVYTTITSMNDELVTPYTQQALDGPNVTNIVLQDLYPGLPAGHAGVAFSPQVWSVVLNALASNPQANPLADPRQSEEQAA
jgi:pimeloyl-ACP methyl ester carboxylesterase